jgi:predicted Zn-dependent protease with MMP-like domain
MIEHLPHLEPEQFDELVSDVLDELPADWGSILDNLAVTVEDEPDPGDAATPDEPTGDVFGRFRRSTASIQFIGGGLTSPTPGIPPEITLYQGPLERASATIADLRTHVRETLIREIGIALGFRDAEADTDGDDDEEPDETAHE